MRKTAGLAAVLATVASVGTATAQTESIDFNGYNPKAASTWGESDHFASLGDNCQPVIDNVVTDRPTSREQLSDCALALNNSRFFYYNIIGEGVPLMARSPFIANCHTAFSDVSTNHETGTMERTRQYANHVAQKTWGCLSAGGSHAGAINIEDNMRQLYGTQRIDLNMANRTNDVTYCLGAAANYSDPMYNNSVSYDAQMCKDIWGRGEQRLPTRSNGPSVQGI